MNRRARWRVILLALTVGAGTVAALTLPQSSNAGLPVTVPCLHAIEVLPGLCSHGNDALSQAGPEAPSSASGPACDGDGVSGKRVQVIVARASDTPDRSQDALSQVNGWAAAVDTALDDSAAQTGGHRRVRWVQNSDCTIHTENLTLPASADDDFGATIQALQATGHTSVDRKYLIWFDASTYCGIGTVVSDDSPSLYNESNTTTGYARVDRPCWNSGTATHELGHTLGAVQLSAPHSDGSWHCNVEASIMCYGGTQTYLCPPEDERLFDCTKDSHYNVAPSPGSWLATHYNVANSGFLVGAPIAPPSPTPAPTRRCVVVLVKICH